MNLFLYIVGELFDDLMKLATPVAMLAALIGILWLGDNLFSVISSIFSSLFLAL